MASVLGDGLGLGDLFEQDQPQALYRRMLGLGYGQDPRSRFLGSLYPETYQGFLGQLPARGANFSFGQYLGEQQPGIQQEWQRQAPGDRGLRYSNYLGHTRYLL